MLFYVVRHAEAEKGITDGIRPLTEKGIKDAGDMGCFLKKLAITPDIIFHSPLLRAKQTAEILDKYIKPADGIKETDGLLPGDSPDIWVKRMKEYKFTVMIVGHLPHLGLLASLLLSVKTGRDDIIRLKKTATACFERNSDGTFCLQWLVAPKLLR